MTPSLEERSVANLGASDSEMRRLAGFARAADDIAPAVRPPNRKAPTVLRFIPLLEMADQLGPPEWLVRNILERNVIACLYGPPDSFKSFFGLDLGLSLASDRALYGKKVKAGPVLVLIGEGRNGYLRRIRAWCLHNGVDPADIQIHISSTSGSLTSEIGRAELEAVVAEFSAKHGPPVLVLVDTLARNFGPGDESSSRDMGAALDTCAAIRDMTGASVLLIHHSGKDASKGARGSSALYGGVDAEYQMSRQPDGTVLLVNNKMKDAPRHPPITLRFEVVELGIFDDEGEQVTSGVLVEADALPRVVSALDKREEVRKWKLQGKTVDEITEITGMPRGTVGRHFTAINREVDDYLRAGGGE